MTRDAAEVITAYGGEIYENYSGRGMYGSETAGVVFDSEADFFEAIADLLENDEEDKEEVAKALRKLKTDNMGKSIIYY